MEPTNGLVESKTPQVVNQPITLKYSLHLGALNLTLPPAFNFSVLLFPSSIRHSLPIQCLPTAIKNLILGMHISYYCLYFQSKRLDQEQDLIYIGASQRFLITQSQLLTLLLLEVTRFLIYISEKEHFENFIRVSLLNALYSPWICCFVQYLVCSRKIQRQNAQTS